MLKILFPVVATLFVYYSTTPVIDACFPGLIPNVTNSTGTRVSEKEFVGGLLNAILELGIDLSVSEFECPEKSGFFRDKLDCSTYYNCTEWKFDVKKCESGQAFDEGALKCVPRDDTNCALGPISPDHQCKANGLEPDPADCSKFYVCVDDKAFSQKCGENKKFDKDIKLCLKDDVTCG